MTYLNRRILLRGLGGAIVTAPFLGSLFERSVKADATPAPKRTIVMFTHHGCITNNWFPLKLDGELTAEDLKPTTLAPLAPFAPPAPLPLTPLPLAPACGLLEPATPPFVSPPPPVGAAPAPPGAGFPLPAAFPLPAPPPGSGFASLSEELQATAKQTAQAASSGDASLFMIGSTGISGRVCDNRSTSEARPQRGASQNSLPMRNCSHARSGALYERSVF